MRPLLRLAWAASAIILLAACTKGTYDCEPSGGPVGVNVRLVTPPPGTQIETCFVEFSTCERFRLRRADLRDLGGMRSVFPQPPTGHAIAVLEGTTMRVSLIEPPEAGGEVRTRRVPMTFRADSGHPCSSDEAYADVSFLPPEPREPMSPSPPGTCYRSAASRPHVLAGGCPRRSSTQPVLA